MAPLFCTNMMGHCLRALIEISRRPPFKMSLGNYHPPIVRLWESERCPCRRKHVSVKHRTCSCAPWQTDAEARHVLTVLISSLPTISAFSRWPLSNSHRSMLWSKKQLRIDHYSLYPQTSIFSLLFRVDAEL